MATKPMDTTPVSAFHATAQSGGETVTLSYSLTMTRSGVTFAFSAIAGSVERFRRISVEHPIRCMADQGSLISIDAGSEAFGNLLESISARCTRARVCIVRDPAPK
jgi:hypothetical protein